VLPLIILVVCVIWWNLEMVGVFAKHSTKFVNCCGYGLVFLIVWAGFSEVEGTAHGYKAAKNSSKISYVRKLGKNGTFSYQEHRQTCVLEPPCGLRESAYYAIRGTWVISAGGRSEVSILVGLGCAINTKNEYNDL
jgi:hypothetical protein